jgi:tetratricopeptide (TPR) repeat protein
MIFLLIAQVQDIEEQIEADFLSEIDKIQKPYYNIDDSLYKNKKFEIILRQYKNPKNEKEEFILAEAYYYQKNYKKADEIYSKIIRLSNDTLIIKFSKNAKLWILYHLGLYNNVLKEDNEDSLLLALTNIKLKNFSSAYNISKNFKSDTFLFISGFCAYLLKSYDIALKHFQELYENYPNSPFTPYGIYRIAIIYYRTEFYDKAINYFSILFKNYQNFKLIKNAIYLNAYSYYKLSNYEKSYEWALILIKNYPNDEETKLAKDLLKEIYILRPEIFDSTYEYYDYLKAYKLYRENKCNSAIEVYNIFINSKQKTILFFFKTTIGDAFLNDAYLEIGNCYNQLQNYKNAIEFYKKCKLDECKFNLAINLYLNGQYSESISNFEKLLKNKNFISKIPEIYYYIGLNYLKMNKKKIANEYLTKAKNLYLEAGNYEKVNEIDKLITN